MGSHEPISGGKVEQQLEGGHQEEADDPDPKRRKVELASERNVQDSSEFKRHGVSDVLGSPKPETPRRLSVEPEGPEMLPSRLSVPSVASDDPIVE